MVLSLFTAAMTVIYLITIMVAEGAYKWDESIQETLKNTSALIIGVYAMWNFYVNGLMYLYAPFNEDFCEQILD